MVKIKYDVTESTAEEAKAYKGGFDPIKPGLYAFEIADVKPGYTKGDDGKPDKTKPRLEVVFKCLDAKFKDAQVWAYFVLKGHPSYDKKQAQKFDQLLLATKITDGKSNRSGDLDTDRLKSKKVVVRIRQGRTQDGEPRGEYDSVFPSGTSTGSSDTTTTSDDEEMIEGGDDVIADETDWDARKEELLGADVPTLKAIAKEYELKVSGKKSDVVDALIAFEKEQEDTVASDDDEIIDDDEEIIEDTTEYLTREGLAAMETPEIARIAKEDFDLTIRGKTKREVIDMIITAQAAPGDGGEEEPF